MSTDGLTLYDYFRSTASFRVRMALAYKKLPYSLKEVHLVKEGGEQHQSHYKAVNPFSLVPTLVHGEVVLNQSLAIIQYLEDTYPQESLLPSEPVEKAKVLAFCYDIACDMHPLNNLRVLQYLKKSLSVDDEQKMTWYFNWLQVGFEGIEKTLQNTAKNYCFGDRGSLADICLIAQVYNAKRFEFDMSAYPLIDRIYQTTCELPWVHDVHPERSL